MGGVQHSHPFQRPKATWQTSTSRATPKSLCNQAQAPWGFTTSKAQTHSFSHVFSFTNLPLSGQMWGAGSREGPWEAEALPVPVHTLLQQLTTLLHHPGGPRLAMSRPSQLAFHPPPWRRSSFPSTSQLQKTNGTAIKKHLISAKPLGVQTQNHRGLALPSEERVIYDH